MLLKQSTARNMSVFMTQSSDHVSGLTGATLTITASKDGAAFASITPTVTELASGWYSLALTTTHTNTLGDFVLHITATSADPADILAQVVADLPGASVSSVTGAVASVTAGVTVTTNNDKTGYSLSAGQKVDVDTIKTNPVVNAGTITFPTGATLASTTNITAGTITTTTNLTTNNDKSGYSLSQTFPTNFSALGISAGGHISNVDTLTTYTGNTVQTGDAYARIGAPVGASISADVAGVPAALLDASSGVESGVTLRQGLRLMLASLAGKLSGAAGTTVKIRDTNDTKDRITATVDSDGNRTAITYDVT